MPASPPSLLPPNATPLERALEAATARVGAVPFPVEDLWSPERCPLDWLPWLAWALSVDQWDPAWPEATKRATVASSIAEHRIKGTPASVEAVLARLDDLIHLIEWHEPDGNGMPHTFEVRLPLVTAPGIAPGGERATAAFADAIVREASKAKPLREHMTLVQHLPLAMSIGIVGAARIVRWQRETHTVTTTIASDWATFLQTEDGEPFEAEGATGFLEHA